MTEDAIGSKPNPNPAEVRAIATLCMRWPDVIDSAVRAHWRSSSDERRDDARQKLLQYLLEHAPLYLNRYAPDRDRSSEGAIHAALDQVLREPRGAFRMWVRQMARWVLRDLTREHRRQGEPLEVRVGVDGDSNAIITFERLEVEVETSTTDLDQDAARDVVAELFDRLPLGQRDDVSLFLAAEVARDPNEVYRAWGTTRAAVKKRLRALEGQARGAVALYGA